VTFRTRLARLEVALGARNAPAAGLTAFRSVCRLFELFACAAERGGQDTVWMRSKTAELAAVPDVEERERTAGAILVQMRSIWLPFKGNDIEPAHPPGTVGEERPPRPAILSSPGL
jgi:hypothetical protein